ncbi:hypothetical protein Plec18167_005018 [Paecilomyces lecythidis]|uniref:3-hydroxyisobutyrate dehydrogenase n=1 Tax=Paecilomyces lecythidis TaxID=3004212 RepID=A0ABR3XLJ9_9EURO
MRVGFIGLGVMGTPMAVNLSRQFPLTVWNRSKVKYTTLEQAGVAIGATPGDVVEQSDIVFIMLFDGRSIQSIFDDDFEKALRGKTIVNTSSVSVDCSHQLYEQVRQAGGDFIEMPVSGSRVPAEQGRLVGMMAGDQTVAERIRPVLEPITCAAIYCGPIGSGLKTKYAVNLYAITMTVGLAESMNLAVEQGLDQVSFKQVLESGPMASPYSKIKVNKMLEQDWTAQATIKDCYNSASLIQSAAESAGLQLPLIHRCCSLYRQAVESGLGEEDMVSIFKILKKS